MDSVVARPQLALRQPRPKPAAEPPQPARACPLGPPQPPPSHLLFAPAGAPGACPLSPPRRRPPTSLHSRAAGPGCPSAAAGASTVRSRRPRLAPCGNEHGHDDQQQEARRPTDADGGPASAELSGHAKHPWPGFSASPDTWGTNRPRLQGPAKQRGGVRRRRGWGVGAFLRGGWPCAGRAGAWTP